MRAGKKGMTQGVNNVSKQTAKHNALSERVRVSGRARRVATCVALLAPMFAASITLAGSAPAEAAGRTGVTNAAASGGLLEALLFYLVAGAAVISAMGVAMATNIVRMAVWLFVALGSVALLYFLLAASFLGAIQLIVYAGGTLVLLIFGVMLSSKSPWAKFTPSKLELLAAGGVSLTLVVTLAIILTRAIWPEAEGALAGTSVADIGRSLLTVYLVPFEVAGVLLMIVMVGAAHLARQDQT